MIVILIISIVTTLRCACAFGFICILFPQEQREDQKELQRVVQKHSHLQFHWVYNLIFLSVLLYCSDTVSRRSAPVII